MECISKEIDSLPTKFDYILLLGDFNSEPSDNTMTMSCQRHNLKSLINERTSYKNPNKPSYIDLIMTDRPKSFQNSCTFGTGPSDFDKMNLSILKASFKKQKSRVLNYCRYKFYNNKFFREQFLSKLNNKSKQDNSLERFELTYLTVLNSITTLKHKFIRANQTPAMIKELQRVFISDQI